MNIKLSDFDLRILAECAFLIPRISKGPEVFVACDRLREMNLINDQAQPTRIGLDILVNCYHDLPNNWHWG